MTSRHLICSVASVAILLGATALFAEGTPKPADAPADVTTKPADPTTKPADAAPAEAVVSPDAQKVIDQISEAYGKLKTLDLSGKLSSTIEAGGEKQDKAADFTASFSAPNKFRHSLTDDILLGSTGEKAYSYRKDRNLYSMADAAKDKVATRNLPAPLPKILTVQNPSLMLALAKEPARELTEGVTSIEKVDDTKLGDLSCPTLKLALKNKFILMLVVDPQTHFLRRVVTDNRAELEQNGVPEVKTATYTVDYTTTAAGGDVPDKQFAWAPPEGAKDAAAVQTASDDDPRPSDALVGQDAPDFKLTGLDGKEVALADLKGKVVILDFWATWCPPCRASLPHLNKLYDEKKGEGLQVFAVDQQEDKEKVQAFVDKTKLGVPVLLDSNGDVGGKYKVTGIPQTVVIGKDGKVKKVIVGFNPEATPEELHKAVDEAMK